MQGFSRIFLLAFSVIFLVTAVSGSSYRVQTDVKYEYPSIITSARSATVFNYTVTNPTTFSKTNMETRLSGVTAEFESGSSSISYSLPAGASKKFTIIVSPATSGQHYLRIINENKNLEIQTVDKIPVYSPPSAAGRHSLPGIGLTQLLFLLASSLLAFRKA